MFGQGPVAHTRLRGDARDRDDRGVREKLATGILNIFQ
jgi:hypothetical protein